MSWPVNSSHIIYAQWSSKMCLYVIVSSLFVLSRTCFHHNITNNDLPLIISKIIYSCFNLMHISKNTNDSVANLLKRWIFHFFLNWMEKRAGMLVIYYLIIVRILINSLGNSHQSYLKFWIHPWLVEYI